MGPLCPLIRFPTEKRVMDRSIYSLQAKVDYLSQEYPVKDFYCYVSNRHWLTISAHNPPPLPGSSWISFFAVYRCQPMGEDGLGKICKKKYKLRVQEDSTRFCFTNTELSWRKPSRNGSHGFGTRGASLSWNRSKTIRPPLPSLRRANPNRRIMPSWRGRCVSYKCFDNGIWYITV